MWLRHVDEGTLPAARLMDDETAGRLWENAALRSVRAW